MSELKFLTYNIMLKPSDLLILNNEYKAERSKLFAANYLAAFDLVCFQETFDTCHSIKEQLLEAAAELGFSHFVKSAAPPLLSTFSVDGGLTILSRKPIVAADELTFPPGYGLDRVSSKGCLYAAVEVAPGKRVHVFNAHTQAHYCFHGEEKVYVYRLKRLNQLMRMRAFVAEMLREHFVEGDLAVMCGDFNVDWNVEEMYRDYACMLSKVHELDASFLRPFENEYDLVMDFFHFRNDAFKLTNVFLEQNGQQAVTYADYEVDPISGERIPKETVLTSPNENCIKNGFDYIFRVEVFDESGKAMPSGIEFKENTCKTEEFKTDVGFLTHLSDHYGVSATIRY